MKSMLWFLLAGGGFCLLCVALYAPLTTRHYVLQLSQLTHSSQMALTSTPIHTTQSPITIALLSDLHSGRIYQEQILATLQATPPDLIALSGDMVDDDEDMQGAWEFFAALHSRFPHIPKLYVSGNHEFWSGEIVYIKQKLREFGVSVLDFHAPCQRLLVHGRELVVFGVDDPYFSAYDEQGKRKPLNAIKNTENLAISQDQWDRGKWKGGAWEQEWAQLVRAAIDLGTCPLESNLDLRVDSAPIRILLSHRPEFIELFQSLPVDLILSGHTHGGQVRIPYLLNGLYAPNQGIFPRFSGGVYRLDSHTPRSKMPDSRRAAAGTLRAPRDQYLIISRGLSFNYRLPRVFNPPEVVFITLAY